MTLTKFAQHSHLGDEIIVYGSALGIGSGCKCVKLTTITINTTKLLTVVILGKKIIAIDCFCDFTLRFKLGVINILYIKVTVFS